MAERAPWRNKTTAPMTDGSLLLLDDEPPWRVNTEPAAATAMRVERRRLSIRPHGLGDGADGGRAVVTNADFS